MLRRVGRDRFLNMFHSNGQSFHETEAPFARNISPELIDKTDLNQKQR